MKQKILIIGSGPLPNDKEGIREAAGLRTHQFFQPIKKAGHNGVLFCIHNNSKIPDDEKNRENRENGGNWDIIRGHRHDKNLKKKIIKIIQTLKPDVIVGVNTFPSFIASEICPKNIPFWADLNGWIMAEAQARGFAEKTNVHFANAWRQEMSILSTADKISTVSSPQKFATIGELVSLGYIQIENFHEEKVFAFPNCTEFFEIDNFDKNTKKVSTLSGESVETQGCSQKLFRGSKVPENAFVISWVGGYNNWVDEKTLFEAVDNAMSKVSTLYFVSTGGAITNVADDTFGRFKQYIASSQHKERYIFLGWIETSDMKKIYEESDAGINADFLCIETETGARNRINEMLKFGLPVITTGGSEIAEEIGDYGAGICVENENSEELTDAIIKMSLLSTEERAKISQSGQEMSTLVYSSEKVLQPLLSFISSPEKTILTPLKQTSLFSFLKNAMWYAKKNGMKTFFNKVLQRLF